MSFLIYRTTHFITLHAHCRHLHLVHEIFTKFPSGKLAACEKQELNIQPKPFKILKPSGAITINSVKEALEHIVPMTHLTKVGREQTYQISKLDPTLSTADKQSGGIKETAGRRDGNAREIHLKTNASSPYLAHVLGKAYQVLSFKDRNLRRVEFHVNAEGDYSIEWFLENCPHLRPEIILAAMPPGTMVLAPPLTEGRRKIMWAVYRTLTSVEASERLNRRAELQAKGLLQEAANLEVGVSGSKVNDAIRQIATDKRASDLSSERTNIDQRQIEQKPPSQSGEEAKRPRNLLRNVQLWSKPSKKFKLAWKREPYQTSKRFLAKQQKRRAQAEDETKATADEKHSSKMRKKSISKSPVQEYIFNSNAPLAGKPKLGS